MTNYSNLHMVVILFLSKSECDYHVTMT